MTARHLRTRAVRVVLGVLCVIAPFAGALIAVRWAPPTHVDIAGQDVSVKPVLGQDTSRLQNGAIVRGDHARIPVLGKDVGVDIGVDWNRLIPSDKNTRAYLTQLWDDPQPELARIRAAARTYVIEWSAIGFVSTTLVVAGVALVLASRRRKLAGYAPAEALVVRRHNASLRRVSAVLGVVGLVGVDALGVAAYLHEDHHVVVSSRLFDGTTLEGTEVDGLIGNILPFLSILQPRTSFYDRVSTNLEQAVADEPDLAAQDDRTVFVVAEDFEDVNGMARAVGETARLVGADFIGFTGDLTFAGKVVESYLIDTLDFYSESTPVYFAPGLHDTPEILRVAQARGWHVADGVVQEIAGVSVLTAADPRISTVGDFGSGDLLRDPDTDVETFTTDLIAATCASRPDFVLLHDHRIGAQVAEAGCATKAVIDGRSYDFVGPQRRQTGSGAGSTEFTGGSGGGHTDTEPDPGPVQHPARYEVFTVDEATGEVRYSVFTVAPNASVTVTPAISLEVEWRDYLATGRTEPATP